MRVVVCVPVYNEARTVAAVLDDIAAQPVVHHLVVVEDGSTDGTAEILDTWARAHPGCVTLLKHQRNCGYSGALLTGFRHVVSAYHRGEYTPNDVLATIDADGQHDASELPRFCATLEHEGLDVLWARRDFSGYPWYKRAGNGLMSAAGSLFAGVRFHDVESGYCLFRMKALDAALQHHRRDWRYSISMTLAVTMARLGFKMSNEPVASIKLYRSRTRFMDVFIDTVALAHAWYQVEAAKLRASPAARRRLLSGGLLALAFLAMIGLIGARNIYLGADSMNNYAHVWYISKRLFGDGVLPFHIEFLDGGDALAFPYGFVPWTIAAVLRPALGDFAVTWTMLAGVGLLALVVFRTQLGRSYWFLVLFLACPLLIESIISFQMAYIWALLFAYLYVYELRRGRWWRAGVWFVVAAGTHLLIMGLLLALYNAWAFLRHKDQRAAVAAISLVGAALLAPEMWYVAQTPAAEESSFGQLVGTTVATLLPRAILFVWPMALAALARRPRSFLMHARVAPLLGVIAVAYVLPVNGVSQPFDGFYGLYHSARNEYTAFLNSATFVPRAVYRVMEATNQEQGQYFFMKRGAVLSHEFFGESMKRQKWALDQYVGFLRQRRISYVVLHRSYRRGYKDEFESEQAALETLTAQDRARVLFAEPNHIYTVYDVAAASGAKALARAPS